MKATILFISGLLVLLSFSVCVNGQDTQVDVRLYQSEMKSEDSGCYDIQVRLTEPEYQQVALGSQNYRIYYDASVMRFLRERTRSHLNGHGYMDVRVLQAIHNSNAAGYGNLDFGESLGFINMSISDSGDPRILLSLNQVWLSCAEICFEKSATDSPGNIVFARKGLTDGYATAFTGISIFVDSAPVEGIISSYGDIHSSASSSSDIMVNNDLRN